MLFLPIDPLPYLYAPSKTASPYVTRFEVNRDELVDYYETHPNKIVVTDCTDGICDEQEQLVLDYFMEQGYQLSVIRDDMIMVFR